MSLTMNAPAVEAAPTAPVPEVDLNAPLVITKTMALELLERAVAEKGANHWASCFYVARNGLTGALSPVCMVGTALSYVGVPLETLWEHNGTVIGGIVLPGVEMDFEAVQVFDVAQSQQDANVIWGEALAEARRV